jgi:cysteine desulfuration protein SufE
LAALDLVLKHHYVVANTIKVAKMPTEAFQEIAETFEFLDDWDDRYRYVIDLGKAMPPLDDAFKVPATKVDGCASQVWIVPKIDGQGPDAKFGFQGDSDAMIVRGLIAILSSIYNGLTAQKASEINALELMATLGLDSHLSAQRSNGLRAMVVLLGEQANRVAHST